MLGVWDGGIMLRTVPPLREEVRGIREEENKEAVREEHPQEYHPKEPVKEGFRPIRGQEWVRVNLLNSRASVTLVANMATGLLSVQALGKFRRQLRSEEYG